ncbi:hypothetical protein ACGFWI_17170 [Streptomyces sp. NPDC048434]|uniref:hypothetical protein n=1 Tax=Streptomyces sp. NPDC048434 TaxID=3365549 RepID=UPI0037129E4B
MLAERSARNPRRIKRLVNGFVLEATLNPMWDDFATEAVVRTLLLQYFYPDFYRMVAGAAGSGTGDVIAEFRTYRQVRRLLRAPAPIPPAELPAVTRFLREHDLPEQEMDRRDETLRQLERQLPSGFPDMVTDQEFTSLIDGMVALPRSEALLLRLRAGAALPAAVEPDPAPYLRTLPPRAQPSGRAYGTMPAGRAAAPRATRCCGACTSSGWTITRGTTRSWSAPSGRRVRWCGSPRIPVPRTPPLPSSRRR